MAAPATSGMTASQWWHINGKPRVYERGLTYTASGSTLTVADLNDVTGYGDFADIFVQATLTVTIPAGLQAKVSQYFPFNLFIPSNDVGGVKQQSVDSYIHFLEMITRKGDGADPSYFGVGGAGGNDVSTTVWNLSNSAGSLIGSTTSTQSQTVTVTANYWFRYYFRQDPADIVNAYGYMPYGSETFRPHLTFAMNTLVGNDPWINPILLNGNTGITATLALTGNVDWHALNVPFLPYGFQGSVPPLTVGMARFTAVDSLPINSVGALVPIKHRVAMLYHKIFHCVYINSAPDTADITDFQMASNAASDGIIWEYNDSKLLSYHTVNLRRYGRLLPSGVLVADFQSGNFPSQQLGSEIMTPYQALAQSYGLSLTPTMQSGLTVSSSVTLTSTDVSNIKVAALGLQPVNY